MAGSGPWPEGVRRVAEALRAHGAGHPHAVFRLTPADLRAWTGAPVADVTVR